MTVRRAETRGTAEERYHWAMRLVELAHPLIAQLRDITQGDSELFSICGDADTWVEDYLDGPAPE